MKGYVKIDNGIFSLGMKASTMRVLVCLLACGRKHVDPDTGTVDPNTVTVSKTAADLMERCRCSRQTFYAALSELKDLGILQAEHTYRYSDAERRLIYAKNTYTLDLAKLKNSAEGYSRVPRALLGAKITHNAFLVALYLYRLVGGSDRAYPSLRKLGQYLCMAHSSICDAMKQIRKLYIFIRSHCRLWSWLGKRLSKCYACNTYRPTYSAGIPAIVGIKNTPTLFVGGGGPKIIQHPVINNITGVFYSQEKNKVFSIYSTLYKNIDRIRQKVSGALGTLASIFRPRSKDRS